MALVDWLQDHDYSVPDSILPVIQHYVEEDMNFIALRLSPNAGVDQMQPVRVTTPGMNPVFPLKMIAAGVTDRVGLELFVFGEGRWDTANFGNATIDPSQLLWDWAANQFNYEDVFASTLESTMGGRAWITEYSGPLPGLLDSYSTVDEMGMIHSPAEDMAVVRASLATPDVTRLRTELRAEHLDEDLILQASLISGGVSNFVSVDREVNRPVCPTTCADPSRPGGAVVGAPGAGTTAFGSGRGDGICSASAMGGRSGFTLGILAALGLVLGWLGRRRG
jgi:hypothetical protein